MTEAHLGDALSALLDGELSSDEAAAARAHLAECPSCADELAEVDAARRAVRGLPPVDPPSSFRPRRRPLAPLAAAAAALVLFAWAPLGGPRVSPKVARLVAAGSDGEIPPFDSHVHVEWVDGAGSHTAELEMSPGEGGALAPSSTSAFLGDQAVWPLVWPGPARHRPPVMPAKYQVEKGPVEAVAGRQALDVSLREQGVLVEQLALDPQTGLALRRAVFDGSGHRVRLVEVERMDTASQPVATTVPARPGPAGPPGAKAVATVAPPFRAPVVLDGDYRRQAVYAWGQVVDAVYTDGMHTLSVFAQAGRLSDAHLPAGADRWTLGPARSPARHYRWPGGDIVVWQAGGVVYTVVGDAPADELRQAAASIPGARPLSTTSKLRRTCRNVADALLGR